MTEMNAGYRMSKRFTMVAVVATVPLFVGLAGCDGQHPVENQEIASHPSASVPTELASVEASLCWAKKPGFLEIEIKNIGTRPFSFLDIKEGSACCEEFWEVEVQLASGKTRKPTMFYSLVDVPWKASIEPGKTYIREIQPGAYVDYYRPKANEVGTIIVHYRVKHPNDWATMLAPPYPTFSTKPLKGKLADYLVH